MVPPILPDVQVQPRRSLGDEQQLGPRRELPCCQPLRRQELPHSELLVSSWEGAQVSEGSRAPGRMGCVGHLLSEVLLVHLSLGNAGSQADRSPAKSFWVWGGVQGHVGGLGVPIPQQKLPRGNALGDDKGRLITIVHVHCRWGAFPPFPSSDTRALESVCKWVCVCVCVCVSSPLPRDPVLPWTLPQEVGESGGCGLWWHSPEKQEPLPEAGGATPCVFSACVPGCPWKERGTWDLPMAIPGLVSLWKETGNYSLLAVELTVGDDGLQGAAVLMCGSAEREALAEGVEVSVSSVFIKHPPEWWSSGPASLPPGPHPGGPTGSPKQLRDVL